MRSIIMRAELIPLVLALAGPAHAELAPVVMHVAPMTAAGDDLCDLLKSDRHDRCRPLAHLDRATVYQAGSPQGIRRFVLAIDQGDDVLVSPALDLPPLLSADDGSLDSATPTMRTVQIDGRPGIVLDVVSKFHRGTKRDQTHWQTESLVGCARTAAGAFKCSTVDVGSCEATIDPDGGIATSCGGHARLTLDARS